jgi:hypothetical protein
VETNKGKKITVNEIGATSSALLKGSWRNVAWNKVKRTTGCFTLYYWNE